MSSYILSSGSLPIIILVGIAVVAVIIVLVVLILKLSRKNELLKREFITIIAHKFRTPLTQIKWLVENMVTSEQDSYKKESLTEINKSNQNLISLTSTLIELTDSDHSSIGEYVFERVDLCKFVRGIGDNMKNLFHDKNIFFAVQCLVSPDEIIVNIDKARMEFVLQVLMENAYFYSPPGRNVDVVVTNTQHHAQIAVIDHGIGIDPGDMNNIFSKFFRAKNAILYDTEGFGVSLFMSDTIARRHKGKIEAISDGLNQGSTFKVTLPITN